MQQNPRLSVAHSKGQVQKKTNRLLLSNRQKAVTKQLYNYDCCINLPMSIRT